jgi:hypothetical protein
LIIIKDLLKVIISLLIIIKSPLNVITDVLFVIKRLLNVFKTPLSIFKGLLIVFKDIFIVINRPVIATNGFVRRVSHTPGDLENIRSYINLPVDALNRASKALPSGAARAKCRRELPRQNHRVGKSAGMARAPRQPGFAF